MGYVRNDLRRTRLGFTLIELLVVIAIIALLVSILVPSLKRARDVAKAAVCLVNLRGIGNAFNYYAAENQGYYPAILPGGPDCGEYAKEASGLSDAAWAAADTGGRNYAVALWPYYGDLAMFICPADPYGDTSAKDRASAATWAYEAWDGAPRQSYWANEAVFENGDAYDAVHWIQQWSPRQRAIMCDSRGLGNWRAPMTPEQVLSAHGGSPDDYVLLACCATQRGYTANWGGFYGAMGGGRNHDDGSFDYDYPSSTMTVWEIHPADPAGQWAVETEGGANYLWMDGHAAGQRDLPSLRQMACHNNP